MDEDVWQFGGESEFRREKGCSNQQGVLARAAQCSFIASSRLIDCGDKKLRGCDTVIYEHFPRQAIALKKYSPLHRARRIL
jgi:hypothetical protein